MSLDDAAGVPQAPPGPAAQHAPGRADADLVGVAPRGGERRLGREADQAVLELALASGQGSQAARRVERPERRGQNHLPEGRQVGVRGRAKGEPGDQTALRKLLHLDQAVGAESARDRALRSFHDDGVHPDVDRREAEEGRDMPVAHGPLEGVVGRRGDVHAELLRGHNLAVPLPDEPERRSCSRRGLVGAVCPASACAVGPEVRPHVRGPGEDDAGVPHVESRLAVERDVAAAGGEGLPEAQRGRLRERELHDYPPGRRVLQVGELRRQGRAGPSGRPRRALARHEDLEGGVGDREPVEPLPPVEHVGLEDTHDLALAP
mmetsp:Transcript_15693/g.47089  ORF Transcript_15693/g.47089 Transcript_15693/m.47089 type:complete len:320 (-) Transcript_15693:36-995(-)